MYLKKITKIQSIGKFHSAGISGGEYERYTLFYGGNGRGKTTLCAILRSFKTGTAVIINDRQTLGEQNLPGVQLLLDSGVAKFANGAWNTTGEAVHIFDSTFVTNNVHTGEQVGTDQRRGLYRVIVGTKGVRLAEEVDNLDRQVSETTTKISNEKKVLQQHAPAGETLEKFLALKEDTDIEQKLKDQDAKIKTASQATEIANRAFPKSGPVPSLPGNFQVLIEKTVEGISEEAVEAMQAQLSKHKFDEIGEDWLSTGLQHVHDQSCPFCSASVKGNPLIEHYQQFFDETYRSFKSQLQTLRNEISQTFSEASGLKAHANYTQMAKEIEFWRGFGEVDFAIPPSLEDLADSVKVIGNAALEVLDAKIASPLDTISADALDTALVDWKVVADQLLTCNSSLAQAVVQIQVIKSNVPVVDEKILEQQLANLQAVKKRHDIEVKTLAVGYNDLLTAKAKLVIEKEAKKIDLDTYDSSVLPKYHNAINGYLTQFGAGFKLMKSEKTYQGKQPQWIYTIEINGNAVDITKKSGQGEASFETAMSAGDRSTLALAFFLAQLDLDPDLKNSVIVFDDPFTSLDDFRRVMTAKAIYRIGQKASQTLILSHDKYFLEEVSSKVHGSKCSTFQISSTKTNSSIEPWDLAKEVKEGYLQDHMELQDFHDGNAGTAKSMRTLMRPLLEKYIRYRFPNQIPDDTWLGDMLKIIRADSAHPLQSVYDEIDDINQFTAPFHHDPNEPFVEDEVRAFVGRTLDVVGGC